MNPIIPDGYRPLKYGEMMQKGDIIWKHPGQWEMIYNNFEIGFHLFVKYME